jgi:hypothetical protein
MNCKTMFGSDVRTRLTQVFLLLLALTLFKTTASAAPFVYVVTLSQQFGMLDLATGKFQAIGNPTPDFLTNLVWWHGSLFSLTTPGGANPPGSLAQINPATGEETIRGQTGLGVNAFDLGAVRGKLYLTDFGGNIYSVDPESGVATPITATGIPADPTIPLTFNSDGTFNLCDEGLYSIGGKLYATFDAFDFDPAPTPPTIAHVKVPPALYQIEPATGLATFIAQTDLEIGTLVEVDGKIYGFEGVLDGFDFIFNVPIAHDRLVRLNLATGKTNVLTDVDHSIGVVFGAAPVRRPQ